jgi:uridylate kinase
MKRVEIHRRWAHVVRNPKGYIDPYKVVVGGSATFHSWHSTKASAVKEAARINKVHGGYVEVVKRGK